jgi:hypothetical protein
LDQISSAQLSEWEAYDRIDPIGTFREDIRTSQILALLNNMYNMIYTKEKKTYEISDFMPDWTGERKSAEEQSLASKIIQAFSGIAKRANKTKK